MAYKRFDEKGYNPRYGSSTGRVQKDEFSIDGKSWEYRNPESFNAGYKKGTMGDNTHNRHASEISNPLYDYSYGQVRDAAKQLNIGNVNSQEEVSQLIDHMQSGSKLPESTEVKKEEKPDPYEGTTEFQQTNLKPVQLSQRAAGALAGVQAHKQRFDSVSLKANEMKDAYALNLKSVVGKRGQGAQPSSGWDNGINDDFYQNKLALTKQYLKKGYRA